MTPKDFLAELVLVFLGASGALIAQEWLKDRNDEKEAQSSKIAIRAELGDNLARLSKSLEHQRMRQEFLKSSEAILGENSFAVADLKKKAKLVVTNIEQQDIGLGLHIVPYRRAAWDVALAKGDIRHLPSEDVLRYGRAYAQMNETAELLRGTIVQGSMTNNVWAIDKFARGESTDALAFGRSIRELHAVYQVVERNLATLQRILNESLAEPQGDSRIDVRK